LTYLTDPTYLSRYLAHQTNVHAGR